MEGKEIQTVMRDHFIPIRMAVIQKDTSIGKDVEKLECLHTVCGNVNGAATKESNKKAPQKLKIELLYDPGILLLDIYPRN